MSKAARLPSLSFHRSKQVCSYSCWRVGSMLMSFTSYEAVVVIVSPLEYSCWNNSDRSLELFCIVVFEGH